MNYPSIRIEGAILSPDILERLEDAAGQQSADFGFDRNARVKDEIARAWADAEDYWRIFQRKLETLRPDSAATTETRQQWVVPLLGLLALGRYLTPSLARSAGEGGGGGKISCSNDSREDSGASARRHAQPHRTARRAGRRGLCTRSRRNAAA